MKKYLKHLYLFILLFFLILISFIAWDLINIPAKLDQIEYVGYGEKFYHPQNDTIKFFLLITFCLIFFYYFFSIFFKHSIINIKELYKINITENNKSELNYLCFFIIFLVVLEFLIYDFAILISKIDIFHEGLWLTPSMNFNLTNSFWSNSFIERGLGGNFFPVLAWHFFENESIGSTRLFELFFLFLNKIILIFICKHLSENLNFNKKTKKLFFVIFAICCLTLVEYPDKGYGYFPFRYFILLFFILILFKSFNTKNNFNFNNFFLGLFSSISILWYLDIGFYINCLLILWIIYLILEKKLNILITLLLGIFLGWFLFLIIFPIEEIRSFTLNLSQLSVLIETIGNIRYPSPLFGSDGRATKTLLFFVIEGAMVIYFIFYKKISVSNNSKISLFFLYILSLIVFKYALGRSDSYHIKMGSGLIMVLFIYSILFFLISFFFRFKTKYYNFLMNNNYILYLFLFIVFLNFFSFKKISNILSFKENIYSLISASNEKFLDNEYINLISAYKKILSDNDQDCVQIFTDEIAIPYLLSKKSCTKYYVMATAAPKSMQLAFIEELNFFKPKIILFKSRKFEYKPNVEDRLKLVNNFIKKNYQFYLTHNKWDFYRLIN